jgi:hypothetical protein
MCAVRHAVQRSQYCLLKLKGDGFRAAQCGYRSEGIVRFGFGALYEMPGAANPGRHLVDS